jgi:hypothetical protein
MADAESGDASRCYFLDPPPDLQQRRFSRLGCGSGR